jgi:hypothetical protein
MEWSGAAWYGEVQHGMVRCKAQKTTIGWKAYSRPPTEFTTCAEGDLNTSKGGYSELQTEGDI